MVRRGRLLRMTRMGAKLLNPSRAFVQFAAKDPDGLTEGKAGCGHLRDLRQMTRETAGDLIYDPIKLNCPVLTWCSITPQYGISGGSYP